MRRILLALVLSALAFGATAAAPTALEAQCTYCSLCGGGHRAILNGSAVTSFHSVCLGAECGHPPCGVGLGEPATDDEVDEMKSFLHDAAQGDIVAVANIIERVGDRAVINYERSALQVRGGCDQPDLAEAPVIIHIPLNAVQLAAATDTRRGPVLVVAPRRDMPVTSLGGGQD